MPQNKIIRHLAPAVLPPAVLPALMSLIFPACGSGSHPGPTRFELLTSERSGITFENTLTDTEALNVFTYRNFVNGGGVGIGDLNGDGLADIYLTANQLPNRLFLNEGDFRFRDITDEAGVGGTRRWSTGVSFVDINGDGLLDLYVCNSGNVAAQDRANELFVNQGVNSLGIPTFVDAADAYGLDDEGFSTHASFFDFDGDRDLDAYILNNSLRPAGNSGLRNVRHIRDARGGDKLYRNDDGRFVDVSETAGIYGSEIGFGLGVTVGDINDDGWLDIYISNDFFERDYLYVNNGDGTFSESIENRMRHISLSSMGADMGDINNDGYPEIYVTDMLPESDRRLKTTTTYRSWAVYQTQLRNDYYHQFMRNTLQLNNGDGSFTDVGQIAGVSQTDWSWGALFADFDLDGNTDIFVSNGIYKDLTNQDFIEYLGSDATLRQWTASKERSYLKLLAEIPSEPIPNHLFRNKGDLHFDNVTEPWGLATPSFSNGAAYGDLDNDGDVDLVVNNVNMPAFVYRNRSDEDAPHFVQLELVGDAKNSLGVGATVRIYDEGGIQTREQMPQRGFQSSVDPVLTVGLKAPGPVDSIVVRWPDGAVQTLFGPEADRRLVLDRRDARIRTPPLRPAAATTPFRDATAEVELPYRHIENEFVDFDREALLPWMSSTEGPGAAVGDVNGDGLDDIYLGGAKGAAGTLLLQDRAGRFSSASRAAFEQDSASEDVDAALFDADSDGDLDLYVVSGGSDFSAGDPALEDRLYINDGAGRMARSDGLPAWAESNAAVAVADYDGDRDLDLFVGGRLVPSRYGLDPTSRLLRNEGEGRFIDVTNFAAPGLDRVGMVTDATWTDFDGDTHPDLVVVGQWMPVTLFHNDANGRLLNVTVSAGLDSTDGLWYSVTAADLDGDGDADLVGGNLGLNTKLRAAADAPMSLYVSDFDRNGSVEQILFYFNGEGSYPLALRGELLGQLPYLGKKYVRHEDYAEQTAADIFGLDDLAKAVERRVYTLETSVFENVGDGSFRRTPLPFEAQLAPVFDILVEDVTDDLIPDILLAGNLLEVQPSIGRMDASYGVVLNGTDRSFRFEPQSSLRSGFHVDGQARHLLPMNLARHAPAVLVVRNNDAVLVFERRPGQGLALNTPTP